MAITTKPPPPWRLTGKPKTKGCKQEYGAQNTVANSCSKRGSSLPLRCFGRLGVSKLPVPPMRPASLLPVGGSAALSRFGRQSSKLSPLPSLHVGRVTVSRTKHSVKSIPRRKLMATRRQKSTLKPRTNVNASSTQSKCGPGTTITSEGNCVPATPSNVFGMAQTTVGWTPIPSDYSCETRKPTGVLLRKLIDVEETRRQAEMQPSVAVVQPAGPVRPISVAAAVTDTSHYIFSATA